MFVTTSVAQALAFASKVAIAMVIPQIASCVSIYSTRRAFQLSFFSSISNCLSLILDSRMWQHTNNIPVHSTKVGVRSWLVILISIFLYLVIVASDLLVFQLASKRTDWKFYRNSDLDLNFKATNVRMTNTFNLSAPLALVDEDGAVAAFRNRTYIPAEHYVYLNNTPERFMNTVEGYDTFENLWDVSNLTATPKYPEYSQGNFSCFSGQQIEAGQVSNGLPLTAITCYAPGTPSSSPYTPAIGFNKKSSLQVFQTDDGAHFTIMTSRQRDMQRINETGSLPSTTWDFLQSSTANFTLISNQVNGTTSPRNLSIAYDFLRHWRSSDYNSRVILGFYKIEKTMAYSVIPVYTYTYLVVDIIGLGRVQDPDDYYATPGLINFNYFSYNVQNLFVPGKKIKDEFIGIDEHQLYGPRSTSILTDNTPEHMIITMLDNPRPPTEVGAVEMVDGWPALLLIACSGGLSLLLYIYRLAHLLGTGSRLPFDPHLEVFHSALTGRNVSSVDSLLVKMQETDLVMVNGYAPEADTNKIGLVPKSMSILPFARDKVLR